MPHELPLPDDLKHLIEKREQDRRKSQAAQSPPIKEDRRSGLDRRRKKPAPRRRTS